MAVIFVLFVNVLRSYARKHKVLFVNTHCIYYWALIGSYIMLIITTLSCLQSLWMPIKDHSKSSIMQFICDSRTSSFQYDVCSRPRMTNDTIFIRLLSDFILVIFDAILPLLCNVYCAVRQLCCIMYVIKVTYVYLYVYLYGDRYFVVQLFFIKIYSCVVRTWIEQDARYSAISAV